MRKKRPIIIARFRGDYKFLSNFYESPMKFEEHTYPTVEHAYQERKTLDEKRCEIIRSAKTPMEAAKLGRSKETKVRDDWFNGLKGSIMKELVYQKFKQNDDLAQKLIDTGNAFLIEGNYWHDNYFGLCSCPKCHEGEQPQNILGKILMEVRNELRK